MLLLFLSTFKPKHRRLSLVGDAGCDFRRVTSKGGGHLPNGEVYFLIPNEHNMARAQQKRASSFSVLCNDSPWPEDDNVSEE